MVRRCGSLPRRGQPAERVRAYHVRRLADVPIAGHGVVTELPNHGAAGAHGDTRCCGARHWRCSAWTTSPLRRGRRYATVLIDAVTYRRVDVLAGCKADTLAAWLRGHPRVTVVCRDESAAYAEGIRQVVQVADRWHLWHNLAAAVSKTVTAHSRCRHTGPSRPHRNA